MILDDIRQARYKQPFEPFHLRLANGDEIPVNSWEVISIAPLRVVVINEDGSLTMLDPQPIEAVVYTANQV